MKHLTSVRPLSREDVETLLHVAEEMEGITKQGGENLLKGHILANLFFEPSTRTRLSFETAMLRLGGSVLTVSGMEGSSLQKGESLEDTIRVIGGYADVICMRHPEKGSADRAAAVSAVPFINAGDGSGEHPTQALLDLYTIRKECGRMENISVAIVGDLRYGRTAHSLALLLSLWSGNRFTFVSPDELRMPQEVTNVLAEQRISYEETTELVPALSTDILYMTRIQKERFENPAQYDRLKGKYVLRPEHLAGRGTVVMHPLPRVGEIDERVDGLPNAAYFRQARNGVPVRMAILARLLGKI